jgi:signal transduction histidine kinase
VWSEVTGASDGILHIAAAPFAGRVGLRHIGAAPITSHAGAVGGHLMVPALGGGNAREELTDHGVTTETELAPDLPRVDGHRSQLRQVIFNLIHSAIESMDNTMDRNRVLRVISKSQGPDAIIVAVEDTGPGINPTRLDSIFDPFVTTKPDGMGLGLAICSMIVERHGGKLSALSDGKNGARFQLVLPVGLTDSRKPEVTD